MDNPFPTTAGGWGVLIVWVMMLGCVVLMLTALRLALFVGPSRWPQPARDVWTAVPADVQRVVTVIVTSAITWLLLGIVIGSSLVNPLARWLRSLLP